MQNEDKNKRRRITPISVKAVWFKSDRHLCALTGGLSVVVSLDLGWQDVPDGFKQTVVVSRLLKEGS